MRFGDRFLRHKWAVIGLLCFAIRIHAADDALEYRVKAAFLYNFAKFTEWPKTAFANENSPIVFAIVGDNPFGHSLDETTAGKSINSHAIMVKHYNSTKEYLSGEFAHLVFIASSQPQEVKEIIDAVGKLSTLMVTDSSISQGKKGIIDFFMDGNNVRFDVNLALATQSNIKISSEVLKLARTVSN